MAVLAEMMAELHFHTSVFCIFLSVQVFFKVFVHPIGNLFGICNADEISTDELCFLAIGKEEAEDLATKRGGTATVSTVGVKVLIFAFLVIFRKRIEDGRKRPAAVMR